VIREVEEEEEEEEEEEAAAEEGGGQVGQVSRVHFRRQQDWLERLLALLERVLILQQEGGGLAQVSRVRFRQESAVGLRFIHKWLLGRYLFTCLRS